MEHVLLIAINAVAMLLAVNARMGIIKLMGICVRNALIIAPLALRTVLARHAILRQHCTVDYVQQL